jgi:hypothetical protein
MNYIGHMGNPVERGSTVIAMMPMAPGDVAVEGSSLANISTKCHNRARLAEAGAASVKSVPVTQRIPTLDELSKAGQAMDRKGLTRAGRGLHKHGNRPNSSFQKLWGILQAKICRHNFN